MRKTVLHIIDSLETGGAEVLLVGVVNAMRDYDHIIATLTPKNDFKEEFKDTQIIDLGFKNKLSIPKCVSRIKSIIQINEVDLVHSHLLTSTLIGRLSTPGNIPFFFSVHNILSKSAFKLSRLSHWLEKLSYKANHHAIFVSESVKIDYDEQIGIKGKATVLHNYVNDEFFQQEWSKSGHQLNQPIQLVSVGSLKAQKNYHFLIRALSKWENEFNLDIYGDGPLLGDLEQLIKELKLEGSIRLKGNQANIYRDLKKYDLFVMPSEYEGFGISLIEAMAIGLPTLVSNIQTLTTISNDSSLFFELNDAADFLIQLKKLVSDKDLRSNLSEKGQERAAEISKKENYLDLLRKIYSGHVIS